MIPATECDGFTKAQLEAVANFINLKKRVPEMYQSEIGHLRDIFDIELRHQFESSPFWSEDVKKSLDIFCSAAIDILDKVRVKPKPYEPGSLHELKAVLEDMQKQMLNDTMESVTECVCRNPVEICEQYEVPEFYEAPLIHEEGKE